MKRKIDVFTAGCSVCTPVVEMVKSLTCENCEVEIYDLAKDGDAQVYHDKIKEYRITSLPAVLVNGKIIPAAGKALTREQLTTAGVGQPL